MTERLLNSYPSYSECFLNVTQEFLVCTTVHKAKNLPFFNVDTYVRVSLDNKSKCTKIFQNSENPYFNEYFVFELSCTLAELLRLTIMYEVKKNACCKTHPTIGELLIDLFTVWSQPQQSFYKKWGRLESSVGSQTEEKGHLQIDLTIVSANQTSVPAIISCPDADDIESNLIQSLVTSPCNIKYSISLYKGVFLKKSNYRIRVSLAGMKGETSVFKGSTTPEWNKVIQFKWTYPSLAQTFVIQVMSYEKCVAESEIFSSEISFNAVPSLGPTFIHFYDQNNYVGRILMEIKGDKLNPSMESINRTVTKSIQPIVEKTWWTDETFIVEFLTWHGEFIHCNASNMKISMRLGEYTSDRMNCFLTNYNGSTASVKYFIDAGPFKAIHIKCLMPDNRLKLEIDHFMFALAEQMRTELDNFKLFQLKYPQNDSVHCKCLKVIVKSILKQVEKLQSSIGLQYNGLKQLTVWEENRLAYLKDFLELLCKSLKDLRHQLITIRNRQISCDKLLQGLQQLRGQIELNFQTRIQDEWPELHLLMGLDGSKGTSKEFAICKLNARHFFYSQRNECNGRWSGIPRNFVFKDTICSHTCQNCGCIRGFVYGWLRIATEVEQSEFFANPDWEQKERFYYQPKVQTSFICRLFIHQAKIQPGADKTGLCDARLKIFFGGERVETSTIPASLSPVWNESVTFALRKMPGTLSWYENNSEFLALQVFDIDNSKTNDYLGCGLVELSVYNQTEPLTEILSEHQEFESVVPPRNSSGSLLANECGILNFMNWSTIGAVKQTFKDLKCQSYPVLKWTPLAHMGAARVEVLVSGQLLQVHEDELQAHSKAVLTKGLPRDIQPVMRRYLLKVTFIGLRNCQQLSSFSLGRYKIYLRLGELVLKSSISGKKRRNSINFLENHASGIVDLPEQLEYWPAIIATQIECLGNGREKTLGAAVISNPSKYLRKEMMEVTCDLGGNDESTVVILEDDYDTDRTPLLSQRPILKKSLKTRCKDWFNKVFPENQALIKQTAYIHIDESDFSWWTKFYNSMYLEEKNMNKTSKHQLVIYASELEKEPSFSYLTDWAEAYRLVHGVKIKKNQPPKEEIYATLKMHLSLVPCRCNIPNLAKLASATSKISRKLNPTNEVFEESKVVVRVYIIQGIQLRSLDARSQSDSFVKLQLGEHTFSDRAHYLPNQSNPIFGKRFQMDAVIPREHILQISILDRGGCHDELIGSTFIDLEDRLRSRHRATVGIANEFNRIGYNMWRDELTPYEILKNICTKHNIGPPLFQGNRVVLDGVTFQDTTVISTDEDLQERLSLSVLKDIQHVPSIGYRIVPEHVETRSLYHHDRPGIEQGKLQLWIEIFDSDNLPPPIDITPTPARMYELRIIVYNCSDVRMEEKNVFGTAMSDIYIRAWCQDSEAYQDTDVHYRSLTGEGNFNWRMIFPLKYSTAEDMMVIKRKGGLLEQYETKQPPMMYFQIWENDALSADDFLGAMEICLSNFPQPFENPKSCSEKQVYKKRKAINLFKEKTVKGWFPCKGKSEKGELVLAGKLELELQILSENEAAMSPAGLGRSPPNALPTPVRPAASFNPLTNPLKIVKHILVPALKKSLCYCIVIAVLVLVLLVFLKHLPSDVIEIADSNI